MSEQKEDYFYISCKTSTGTEWAMHPVKTNGMLIQWSPDITKATAWPKTKLSVAEILSRIIPGYKKWYPSEYMELLSNRLEIAQKRQDILIHAMQKTEEITGCPIALGKRRVIKKPSIEDRLPIELLRYKRLHSTK